MTAGDQGIWIWAEQHGGILAGGVLEALTAGRSLAESSGQELAAVVLGPGADSAISPLFAAGADVVYHVRGLPDTQEELYVGALSELIARYRPAALLVAGTIAGRSLAPRLAARLGVSLAAETTALAMEGTDLRPTVSLYGGNVLATLRLGGWPKMALLRPKVWPSAVLVPGRSGRLVTVEARAGAVRTAVRRLVEEVSDGVKLDDADIVVSGGMGLGAPENFRLVFDLAKVLGAAVGASRAVVDAGWIPYKHQVGQTGKIVNPKIYVACGISGAIQHLAGMRTAETIVAVNTDPNAPIFQVATYGVVGDVHEVLPALTAEFSRILGKA